MSKFEEVMIRVKERIELNEILKEMEGDVIGINVKDVEVILKELENVKADLYEANNCISDLLDVAKGREKIIDLMAEQLATPIHDKEWIKKYYERESKNGN